MPSSDKKFDCSTSTLTNILKKIEYCCNAKEKIEILTNIVRDIIINKEPYASTNQVERIKFCTGVIKVLRDIPIQKEHILCIKLFELFFNSYNIRYAPLYRSVHCQSEEVSRADVEHHILALLQLRKDVVTLSNNANPIGEEISKYTHNLAVDCFSFALASSTNKRRVAIQKIVARIGQLVDQKQLEQLSKYYKDRVHDFLANVSPYKTVPAQTKLLLLRIGYYFIMSLTDSNNNEQFSPFIKCCSVFEVCAAAKALEKSESLKRKPVEKMMEKVKVQQKAIESFVLKKDEFFMELSLALQECYETLLSTLEAQEEESQDKTKLTKNQRVTKHMLIL